MNLPTLQFSAWPHVRFIERLKAWFSGGTYLDLLVPLRGDWGTILCDWWVFLFPRSGTNAVVSFLEKKLISWVLLCLESILCDYSEKNWLNFAVVRAKGKSLWSQYTMVSCSHHNFEAQVKEILRYKYQEADSDSTLFTIMLHMHTGDTWHQLLRTVSTS